MSTETQDFIFRKIDGEWKVQGPKGYTGKSVQIKKKDGSFDEKTLGKELPSDTAVYELSDMTGANRFKKQGDQWVVMVNDGKTYEVGDNIKVITKKGEKEYKVKANYDSHVLVDQLS